MAVAFVQSWRTGGTSANAVTGTVTVSGATADNLLVAVAASRSGTAYAASGWTLIQTGEGSIGSAAFYRIASGTSADNFVATWTGSNRYALCVAEYSGLATSSVLDTSAEDASQVSSTTTTISTGTASPTVAGLAVAFYGGNHTASAVEGDLTIDSSFTKRVTTDPTIAVNRAQAAIAELDLSSTSSVSATWTTATAVSGTYGAISIFQEAAGAATVIPNDATQGQSIDNITLTQSNVLAVNALDQAQSIDNLTLVQANVLSVAEIGQAQSLDNITLTQAHIIVVNDLSQGQTLDNLTLTQANILAVADITQAQLIDALTLVQHNIISPNALDQAQGIDNLTLTVAGSLAIQALLQGQTIDNLTLTQAGVLSIADLTQAQLLDAAALTQHYVLVVADLLQSHLLDNVTLSLSGASLAIADMGQAQLLDAPGLVQHAVIAVQDLTQQQILDIATLGGLVIGELQGTIVVYALVGGEVRCYSALDGTITLH